MQSVKEILEGEKMQIIEQLNQDLAQANRTIRHLLYVIYAESTKLEEAVDE